jgi:hypothetical protein
MRSWPVWLAIAGAVACSRDRTLVPESPDGNAVDLVTVDRGHPVDLGPRPEIGRPLDLWLPSDIARPLDLRLRPDIAEPPPDIAKPPPDLAEPPDIRLPPDIAPPPDLVHADLAHGCPPPSIPATTTVHLRVENRSGKDRFVATPSDGFMFPMPCASYGIHSGGAPLFLAFRRIPLCEGVPPPLLRTNAWRRLSPGEGFEIAVWDGRAITLCSFTDDCANYGWPGLGKVTVWNGSHRPFPPGALRAVVAVEEQAPPGCASNDGKNYSCNFGGYDLFARSPAPLTLCPSAKTASADFVLPAMGDITVTLELK